MKITGTHLGILVIVGYFLMTTASNLHADEIKFKFKIFKLIIVQLWFLKFRVEPH